MYATMYIADVWQYAKLYVCRHVHKRVSVCLRMRCLHSLAWNALLLSLSVLLLLYICTFAATSQNHIAVNPRNFIVLHGIPFQNDRPSTSADLLKFFNIYTRFFCSISMRNMYVFLKQNAKYKKVLEN